MVGRAASCHTQADCPVHGKAVHLPEAAAAVGRMGQAGMKLQGAGGADFGIATALASPVVGNLHLQAGILYVAQVSGVFGKRLTVHDP